ncbi:MAG: hypothetical protein OQK76_10745 [Gammaproteobacteria bacterium]|nr:hypothetical protein [Gammaproteobacteria bacterium]MCW8911081.1 hypothetical protein [Gammaproteobacteria bacterium]MCW9005256.1 hypothetical protein [Gammaproteobacteria bacterium]MCW9056840.1 hypothetical protein [Gammaproteobacteria bacterium]
MTQPSSLILSIKPDELSRFCEKLLKRSRDISKTHDALSTLEAFITNFSTTSNHPATYQAIDNILHSFSEQTRQALLDDKTTELIKALKQLKLTKLTDIHHHLSRNGFYQILEIAAAQLSRNEIIATRNWCNSWFNDARLKAEQASGFPESYDLNKANIDVKEFQAMKDTSHFLNNIN